MSQEYAFQLPANNKNLVAQLVEAVPDDWSYCSGQLDISLRGISSKNDSGAGYLIDSSARFGTIGVETLFDSMQSIELGDKSILMERRERVARLLSGLLPSYVRFYRAGEGSRDFGLTPLHSIKRIISHYVEMDYVGDLSFFNNPNDDDYKACVDLHMSPWSEAFPRPDAKRTLEYIDSKPVFSSERREHPPLIKIAYNGKHGGTADMVSSLTAVCESEGLETLDPGDILPGSSYSRQLY